MLQKASPLEQISIIKSLSDTEIEFAVTTSKHNYSRNLFSILLNEFNSRDLEKEQWSYLDNNEPQCPYKFRKLKEFAASGKINKDTLVAKEGFKNWIAADDISGLFIHERNLPSEIPPPQTVTINDYERSISNRPQKSYTFKEEELGFGWSVICILFPIVGLILYFAYNDNRGKKALRIGVISFILAFFLFRAIY